MRTMRTPAFGRDHPLWSLFVKFHLGEVPEAERSEAKSLLFPIHYGSADTTEAWAEIEHMRLERIRAAQIAAVSPDGTRE